METTQHHEPGTVPDAWTPDLLTFDERYTLANVASLNTVRVKSDDGETSPTHEALVNLGLLSRSRSTIDYQLTDAGRAILQELRKPTSVPSADFRSVIVYHSQAVSLFDMMADIPRQSPSALNNLANRIARDFGYQNWAQAYRRTHPDAPPTNGSGGTSGNPIPPTATVTNTSEPPQLAPTPYPFKETDAEFLRRLARGAAPNREEMDTESWRKRLREIATHLEVQPAPDPSPEQPGC